MENKQGKDRVHYLDFRVDSETQRELSTTVILAAKGKIKMNEAITRIENIRQRYMMGLMEEGHRNRLLELQKVPFLEGNEYFPLALKAALKEMVVNNYDYITLNMPGDGGTNTGLSYTKAKDIYGTFLSGMFIKALKKMNIESKPPRTPELPLTSSPEKSAKIIETLNVTNQMRLSAASKLLVLDKPAGGHSEQKKEPMIPRDRAIRIYAALRGALSNPDAGYLVNKKLTADAFSVSGNNPSLSTASYSVHSEPVVDMKRTGSKNGYSHLSTFGITEPFVFALQDELANDSAIESGSTLLTQDDMKAVAEKGAKMAYKSYVRNMFSNLQLDVFGTTTGLDAAVRKWNEAKSKLRQIDYSALHDETAGGSIPEFGKTKEDIELFISYIDTIFGEIYASADYFANADPSKISHQDLLKRGFIVERKNIPQSFIDEINRGQVMYKPGTDGVSASEVGYNTKAWTSGFIGPVSRRNPDKVRNVRLIFNPVDSPQEISSTVTLKLYARDGQNLAGIDKDIVVESVLGPDRSASVSIVSGDEQGQYSAIALSEMTMRLNAMGYDKLSGDYSDLDTLDELARDGYPNEPESPAIARIASKPAIDQAINTKQRESLSSKEAPAPIKQPPVKPSFKPTSWMRQVEGSGLTVTSTDGYIIAFKDKKYRLFNPSKVMIGVFSSEDEARKRAEALGRKGAR